MLRQKFNDSLEQLHQELLAMGLEVCKQLEFLQATLDEEKLENYEEIIAKDSEINAREVAIEKHALEIIALQQPVSTDLRRVITALKASSDIERMGDQIRSIASRLIVLTNFPQYHEIGSQVREILGLIYPFLIGIFEAFEAIDPDKAVQLSLYDERIDSACQIAESHAMDLLKSDPDVGKEFLTIIVHLERLGDYARNVCEWIVYLKLGKFVNL